MNKIELYDNVELLETLVEGKDFSSDDKVDILKGLVGTVIEILDSENVLVEFDYKETKNYVASINISKLKKI